MGFHELALAPYIISPVTSPLSFFDTSWLYYGLISPLLLAFTIWMLIDVFQNSRSWFWFFIILFFQPFGPFIYFVYYKWDDNILYSRFVLRQRAANSMRALEAKVHNIDNAYHRTELGKVYLQQEKYPAAQEQFEKALEWDTDEVDAQANMGYALARQGQCEEALRFIEPVLDTKPKYDYGELMWTAARCKRDMGDTDAALQLMRELAQTHTHAEIHVEYAELLWRNGDETEARKILDMVIAEHPHAPLYQRRREGKFVRKAREMLKKGPSQK